MRGRSSALGITSDVRGLCGRVARPLGDWTSLCFAPSVTTVDAADDDEVEDSLTVESVWG